MSNDYDRRGDSGKYGNANSSSHTTRAPGKITPTSRIQRRAAADAAAPAPIPTPLPPAPEAGAPHIDPFGLQFLDPSVKPTATPGGFVQLQQAVSIDTKEIEDSRATLDVASRDEREVAISPRAGSADESVGSAAPAPLDSPAVGARLHTQPATTIDAPKDADAMAAPAQFLAPPQLAIARRRNVRHHHRLRFDVGAFGGASPDSDEFALAVASYQASTGGALGVDGIAGPKTCEHKGCLPSHVADHVTGHDDAAAGEATSSLESTRDRRDAVGAAERAQPAAVDQSKEDSLPNNRDTLAIQAIQARADGAIALDAKQVHAHAAAGVQGAGGPMPHAAQIKESFGAHAPIVDDIQAHIGGAAADATKAMGAAAYATGNAVAFESAPDVFTAAHEAAHVVQQQAGVQLLGGVGEIGDAYELNADAVAAKVINGESAEHLLGRSTGPANAAVQRAPAAPTAADATSRTAAASAGANMLNRGDRDPLDHVASLLVALPTEAANALRGALNGTLPVSEGCALIAKMLAPAIRAIGLAVQWMHATEQIAWMVDDKERRSRERNLADVFASLDETWASVSGLLALSASRAELNLGAPVLRETFHAATTSATALGYIHNPAHVAAAEIVDACPAGANDQHVPGCTELRPKREQLIDAITSEMNDAIGQFITQLETEEGVLRAGVAKSALLQSIINDTLISALVGLSGGLAAPAAATTMVKAARGAGGASEAAGLATYVAEVEARAAGAAASASTAGGGSLVHAQFVQLVKTGTKFEMTQQSSEDARRRTIDLIPALKSAAHSARNQATIHLPALSDDDLKNLDRKLSGTDFTDVAHVFLERYRAQIEPIGDSFKSGEDTIQQRAVLLEGNGARRLALVSVRIDGSLVGYAARGTLAGLGRIANAVHSITDTDSSTETPTNEQLWEFFVTTERNVDFVRWIDADLVPAAAALSNGQTLALDRVDGGRDEAARGLTP